MFVQSENTHLELDFSVTLGGTPHKNLVQN